MKKYARILALLFVSAALLLSFAVVSFAADGDAIPPYSSTSPSWNYDNTFDKRADGEIIYNANGERHGKVTAVKQDDGNVYALMEYCKGTGTTAAMWDITSTYSAECGVAKYPYFMIEFDIMTQNGI